MKNSGMKNRGNKQKIKNKMVDLNPNISISTFIKWKCSKHNNQNSEIAKIYF